MSEPLDILIKSSIFDRERLLRLSPDYLEFEDKDLKSAPPLRFNADEISAFRCGVKWINGYEFTIGRIYCVDIKSESNKIISLRLKSIYGIRKELLFKKYFNIIDSLYDLYFGNKVHQFIIDFNQGKVIDICGVQFSENGVALDKKSKYFPWDDVGTKSYQTYFAIYSKSKPDNYKAFEYNHEWNVWLLPSFSNAILKAKGYITDENHQE